LAGVRDTKTDRYYANKTEVLRQIFRPEVAEEAKE
jgi:hypothetical protein